VTLNEQRPAEERLGVIRWLCPEFQQNRQRGQIGLGIEMEEANAKPVVRQPWPTTLPERVRAIRDALANAAYPLYSSTLTKQFIRARKQDVQKIADTLVSLNQAREINESYTS
jgi:hypothetical protein